MQIYSVLRMMSIPDWKALGMDTSNVYVDAIPLNTDIRSKRIMRRCAEVLEEDEQCAGSTKDAVGNSF